jgi:hypothetical protein
MVVLWLRSGLENPSRGRVSWPRTEPRVAGGRRGLLDDPHLAVDAQNLRHPGFEFGIAAFQVIADLVRLHLLLVEYLAHRALHQPGEAAVPSRRSVLTRMASQQSRRPQFMRIAQTPYFRPCNLNDLARCL